MPKPAFTCAAASASRARRLACLLLAVSSAGACFDPTVPTGTLVRCSSDEDCAASDQVCDVARERCVSARADIHPPGLVRALFDPPALQGGVARFEVEADEPLAADAPAELAWAADRSLPLALSDVVAGKATFLVPVDDVEEGYYALREVVLTDVAGNRSLTPTTAGVLVDRTSPGILNVTLSDGDPASGDDIYADLAPFDQVVVDFLVTEVLDVAQVGLSVGSAVTGTCEVGALVGQGWRCEASLSGGLVSDGPTLATVTAIDVAGNSARVDVPLIIDAAPPALIPGSSEVLVVGSNGAALGTAVPGARVSVRFSIDEPLLLGGPAAVWLESEGGDVVDLDVQAASPAAQTFTATVVVESGMAAGAWSAFADVEDRVGHRVARLAVLGGEGQPVLVVDEFLASACPSVPGSLTDFDGDGRPLGTGSDCDDTEPTVFFAAPELPGDGLDNDCLGDGDLPIDESVGIFVSPSTGHGGEPPADHPCPASGHRCWPAGSVAYGLFLAEQAGLEWLFLSAEEMALDGTSTISTSLLGGLDTGAWTRTESPTTLSVGTGVTLAPTAVAVESVHFALDAPTDCCVDMPTVAAVHVGTNSAFAVDGPSLFVGPRGGGLVFGSQGFASGTRVVGGRLGGGTGAALQLPSGSLTLVGTHVEGSAYVTTGGRLTLINTVHEGLVSVDAAELAAFHSILRGGTVGLPLAVRRASRALVVNSLLQGYGSSGALYVEHSQPAGPAPEVRLLGVNLFRELGSAPLVQVSEGTSAPYTYTYVHTAPVVEECAWTSCQGALAISEHDVGVLVTEDGHHLPSSPVRGLGLLPDALTPFATALPAAAAADIDGRCRLVDDVVDLGPDEHDDAPFTGASP